MRTTALESPGNARHVLWKQALKLTSDEGVCASMLQCCSRGAKREWKNVLRKSMEHQWRCGRQPSGDSSPGSTRWVLQKQVSKSSVKGACVLMLECRSRGANREWKTVLHKLTEHQQRCGRQPQRCREGATEVRCAHLGKRRCEKREEEHSS